MLVVFLALLSALMLAINASSELEPWNLPLLPQTEFKLGPEFNNTLGKQIPRHLWMAFKDIPKPEDRPEYLTKMFAKNEALNWTLHLANNEDKLNFMEQYFHNTSILWAYKIIHPKLGNSAADIWRYCVLYLFGGLYMDDDSYFEAPWDEVIKKDDTLILSTEKNAYNDDCFKSNYRLSNTQMTIRFNKTAANNFLGRTLVSWAIFAAPRHPVILRTLYNINELVKLEYLHTSAIHMKPRDAGWKMCMCSTGPAVLTASARELIMEDEMNNGTGVSLRWLKRDFFEYGGVFKVHSSSSHHDETHYMRTTTKSHIPLLANYSKTKSESMEGKIVTASGKEIFLIRNDSRLQFDSFDAFLELKYNLKHAIRYSAELINSIPLIQKAITSNDTQYMCCFIPLVNYDVPAIPQY